ncbi:MAG: 50S ribosomal protein L32e [Candidatus Woesearchaeota archaeon]
MKRLLEVRKEKKSKKPEFVQQDYHKKKRLSKKWKRPTGLQSKMRHQFRGYNARVKQGWRSPVLVRGFHGKGLESVLINNVLELSKVRKDQGIIIGSKVGLKKRLDIIAKAEELKLVILNIKPEIVRKKAESMKKQKDEDKKVKDEKKKKTIEDSLKKAEKNAEKKKKSEEKSEISEDEKKSEEKKEKDEVLIHKSM